ncbi:DUF2516 family protein [Brevibacterium litoralis]|uniref:DUF2516 family protein n=1 Tax=Brevibacterium litoralis TaxID=3138935 RepID=UPI0032EB720C
MMHTVAAVQSWVFSAFLVAVFVFSLLALIDSLRYRNEVYAAAGKKSRTMWALITGGAALVSFMAMPPMRLMPMFLTIAALVAAAVYFVDVRKAVRSVDPRFRDR